MLSNKKLIFIILGSAFLVLGVYNHIASNELQGVFAADYLVYAIVSDIIGVVLLFFGFRTKAVTVIPKYE